MILRMASAAVVLTALGACSVMPGSLGGDTPPPANVTDDIERVTDLDALPQAEARAIVAPQAETGGMFSGMFSIFGGKKDVPDDMIAKAVAEAAGAETAASPQAVAPDETADGVAGATAGATDDKPGFFGRLFGGSGASAPAPDRTGPDAQVINFGERIPFGEVATVCDAPSNLGTRIAQTSGYTIYDSAPNSRTPRPHYVTGFDDKCARKFTAALAMIGDVGTHEVVRYNAVNRRQPYSETDSAYEAIKGSYCRVSHGSPCGKRLDSLANTTAFLSIYERFGTNGKWFEILLHEGRVVAAAMEDH